MVFEEQESEQEGILNFNIFLEILATWLSKVKNTFEVELLLL